MAWKDVIQAPEFQVEDKGKVRLKENKIDMPQAIGRWGHLWVLLWDANGRVYYKVEELVIVAYIGPNPGGMTINHKDGYIRNNSKSNLEWV